MRSHRTDRLASVGSRVPGEHSGSLRAVQTEWTPAVFALCRNQIQLDDRHHPRAAFSRACNPILAIEAGCRLIDTAAAYGNEEAVGRAIAASGIDREELWVTTKLGTSKQGFESAQESCKASLDRLGLDYLDLYLIHWPAPSIGKYVESFAGMIESRDQGHVRSIGVSNFTEDHLKAVIEETDEVPAVNQIELHPRLTQAELRQTHADHDVVTQAYSPLGVGRMLEEPTVTSIATEYGQTPAQVLVRWNLQLNNVVVSRSSKPERVAENLDVFGFTLDDEHMTAIEALHDGTRVLHDPMVFTGT